MKRKWKKKIRAFNFYHPFNFWMLKDQFENEARLKIEIVLAGFSIFDICWEHDFFSFDILGFGIYIERW